MVKKKKYRDVNALKYSPLYTERRNHPTPNGGDYSIAFYYDEEHNPCTREEAWYINIVEYTADGEKNYEHYGLTERGSYIDS